MLYCIYVYYVIRTVVCFGEMYVCVCLRACVCVCVVSSSMQSFVFTRWMDYLV